MGLVLKGEAWYLRKQIGGKRTEHSLTISTFKSCFVSNSGQTRESGGGVRFRDCFDIQSRGTRV